jgi:hypothetical protein
MNCLPVHDRYANAVRTTSGDVENFTVRVGGETISVQLRMQRIPQAR